MHSVLGSRAHKVCRLLAAWRYGESAPRQSAHAQGGLAPVSPSGIRSQIDFRERAKHPVREGENSPGEQGGGMDRSTLRLDI